LNLNGSGALVVSSVVSVAVSEAVVAAVVRTEEVTGALLVEQPDNNNVNARKDAAICFFKLITFLF
jgi:hypothetical protein